MIRDEEKIRDLLEFYKDKDFSVHLTLKYGFRNGLTISIKEDSIVFNDEKLGEVLIFLNEIDRVDKREERR